MPAKPKPYVNWAKVPVLLTSAELGILLNEDAPAVRKQLRDGVVPGAKKIGKLWFIERDTLKQYFNGDYAPPAMSEEDAERIAEKVAAKLQAVQQ